MTVRMRREGREPKRGEPYLLWVSCDYCDRPRERLERAKGWANVAGYDLHACPDCQWPSGLELRALPIEIIVARLRKHDLLPEDHVCLTMITTDAPTLFAPGN